MELDIKEISIDRKQVLKFLGYGRKDPAAIILKKLDEEIDKSYELFQPRVFLKSFQLDKSKIDKVAFSHYEIESDYLLGELEDIERIYLCLYTIGKRIEEKIEEYSNSSEMIRAMILDKIGVVALDNIKEKIKLKISEEVSPMNISTELFPSKKDFHISNQKIIHEVFKEENNIINISKHYQFSPVKTVGVLFGIGEDVDKEDMCSRCDSKCF